MEEMQFELNPRGWVGLWTMRMRRGKAFRRKGMFEQRLGDGKSKAHVGRVDGPTGEQVEVHARESCKLMQVLKRRVMWIELSIRKLNLMVHRGEGTRSNVFS